MFKVFQALDVNDPIRNVVDEKVIQYFVKSTPINAIKTSAKIIDAMIYTNPSKLSYFLSQIITPEVLNSSLSADNLSFRIRLASGACRSAQGKYITESPAFDIVSSIITSPVFTHHTEKSVRKSTVKLIKDTFKGSTSSFPINIKPITSTETYCLGAPNQISEASVSINNSKSLFKFYNLDSVAHSYTKQFGEDCGST